MRYSRFAAHLARQGVPVESSVCKEQVYLLGLCGGGASGALVEGVGGLCGQGG